MRMVIELTNVEAFPYEVNEHHQFSLQLGSKVKYFQIVEKENSRPFFGYVVPDPWLEGSSYNLIVSKYTCEEIKFITPPKTKEEKLAEEAVKASEEALRKAKKTLEAIKGNNK